jgi:hypothetical protein
MKQQATRANEAQIRQHIERQKDGLSGDWESDNPILAALIGTAVLAFAIGGMLAAWIAQGAQL